MPTQLKPNSRKSIRQPGWVLLLGVLGIACLMIGLIMLAMLQAPVASRRVIELSCACGGAGLLLVALAWFSRRRKE